MKHPFFVVALSIGIAAAFGVSPQAADRETQQMMADVRILQIQAQELQNAVTAMSQAMTEAINALNARLVEQTEVSRKSFADQKLTVDAVVTDLRVVREKVDDNSVRVGSLAQEIDALRQLVTQLTAPPAGLAPDAPGAAAPPPATTDATPPPPAPVGVVAAGMSPTRMWDQAFADYMAGQYDLAVLGFESYVRTFPRNDERVADAAVHIGHAYFQDGKYEQAVEAYDSAIRMYPTSPSLPDAYYRKGVSLQNLKEMDRARESFEYVIQTYPESAAAIQAKQRLQGLQPQP
jgi:tol-pal system protein YbgF